MSIKRILLLTSMALVAVVVAAPSVAQANVRLTDANGNALAKGDKVTATSSKLVTTTSQGELICKHMVLHLEVVKNGITHVEVKQLGEATTKECEFTTPTGSFPVTITDGTVGVGEKSILTLNTWGTGETSATFVSHIYGDAGHKTIIRTCHFHGKVHAQATPSSPTNLLAVGPLPTMPPTPLTGTGAGCPATGTLHGEFKLEASTGGTAVQVDYVKTG